MILPKNTEVNVLLLKPKKKEKKENLSYATKNMIVECEKLYIQYGNKKNQCYYIFSGY